MSNYENMTDEEAVAAYHAGDFGAVEYICNKYRDIVSRYGKKYYIKGQEEQDVIQEAWLGYLKRFRIMTAPMRFRFTASLSCVSRVRFTRQLRRQIA